MKNESEEGSTLPIAGADQPTVPVYTCVVYVSSSEGGIVSARVANFAAIECQGSSERFVLNKVTKELKSQVMQLVEAGQEVPWIDPPVPPLANERVRSIPLHL